MTLHNFEALYSRYPDVIDQMPASFNSHEFILRLAQQNQTLYIEALFSYRNRVPQTPFRTVHGILAKHLHSYPDLVREVESETSPDIFGNPNQCSRWEKVQTSA